MEPWVQLVGYLVWPVTILVILFVARHAIRNILKRLEERLHDARTAEITASMQGMGITIKTELDAVVSQVESLQSNQDQLTSLASLRLNKFAGVQEEETPSEDIPPELLTLANEYLDLPSVRRTADNFPEWRAQLNELNQIRDDMTDFIISRNVSRDALANSDNQGLLVALASAIQILPGERDLQRLLRASWHVSRLNVKYRFVLAFTRLIEKDLLSKADIDCVQEVLDKFQQGADEPLQLRIQRTRAFIEAKKILEGPT